MTQINRCKFMGIAGRSLAGLAGGMALRHPGHLLSAVTAASTSERPTWTGS